MNLNERHWGEGMRDEQNCIATEWKGLSFIEFFKCLSQVKLHYHFLANCSRFFPFTILSFLYITVYEVYFYSLVSLIPRLSCFYRKQSRKISLLGDVQIIIIVSKENFRFLDHRQVEHMESIQRILSLSISYLGTQIDTVPSLDIQLRHLMWTIKAAVWYSWKEVLESI